MAAQLTYKPELIRQAILVRIKRRKLKYEKTNNFF